MIIISSAFAETNLKGEITNLVCNQTDNPIIIDSTVSVPKDGKLVFNAGCVVFFKAYSGIEVSGNFIVKGTLKSPVIFTSINDNHYNQQSEVFPQPLDWNGITFTLKSDTVFLENFKLMYSVFGIKSYNNRIVLHNAIFSDNGQYDFVVNDALQTVVPGVAYTYNYNPRSSDTLSLQIKMKIYEQKVQRRRVLTRIALWSGVAGAAFDGFAWYKFYDLKFNEYPKLHNNFSAMKRKYSNWEIAGKIAAPTAGTLLLTSLLFYVIPVRGALVNEMKNADNFNFELTPQYGGAALTLQIPDWQK
jgi:hypothetical protein